jgi:hypothetical protein
MKVLLRPGDVLEVGLVDTDGHFEFRYDVEKGHLTVTSDLPDMQGREGVIYDEVFVSTSEGEDPDAPVEARYETTYVIKVLSQEPVPPDMGLDVVLEEATNGLYSAAVQSMTSRLVNVEEMRALLAAQHSSPDFFDPEHYADDGDFGPASSPPPEGAQAPTFGHYDTNDLDDSWQSSWRDHTVSTGQSRSGQFKEPIDFPDLVHVLEDGTKVTWSWLCEGLYGSYDVDRADDVPLLRVYVLTTDEKDTRCALTALTMLTPTTAPPLLERLARELGRRLRVNTSESPRAVLEEWTRSEDMRDLRLEAQVAFINAQTREVQKRGPKGG